MEIITAQLIISTFFEQFSVSFYLFVNFWWKKTTTTTAHEIQFFFQENELLFSFRIMQFRFFHLNEWFVCSSSWKRHNSSHVQWQTNKMNEKLINTCRCLPQVVARNAISVLWAARVCFIHAHAHTQPAYVQANVCFLNNNSIMFDASWIKRAIWSRSRSRETTRCSHSFENINKQ